MTGLEALEGLQRAATDVEYAVADFQQWRALHPDKLAGLAELSEVATCLVEVGRMLDRLTYAARIELKESASGELIAK